MTNDEGTVDQADSSDEQWEQASLEDLIVHIVSVYHESLQVELPRLESMAREVVEEPPGGDSETLAELLSTFLGLKAELGNHLMKEEQILFPMILQGRGEDAGGPIMVMNQEHAGAKAALARLRQLTGNYELPAEAAESRRALWQGLAALEEALHQHIHLEDDILFRRALTG
jgi:regulator of cell morphogenesis and NO signaling